MRLFSFLFSEPDKKSTAPVAFEHTYYTVISQAELRDTLVPSHKFIPSVLWLDVPNIAELRKSQVVVRITISSAMKAELQPIPSSSAYKIPPSANSNLASHYRIEDVRVPQKTGDEEVPDGTTSKKEKEGIRLTSRREEEASIKYEIYSVSRYVKGLDNEMRKIFSNELGF